jgi:hypothetical protein
MQNRLDDTSGPLLPMPHSPFGGFISAISTSRIVYLSTTLLTSISSRKYPTAIMGYEDSVYLAKLAEQAERYEG